MFPKLNVISKVLPADQATTLQDSTASLTSPLHDNAVPGNPENRQRRSSFSISTEFVNLKEESEAEGRRQFQRFLEILKISRPKEDDVYLPYQFRKLIKANMNICSRGLTHALTSQRIFFTHLIKDAASMEEVFARVSSPVLAEIRCFKQVLEDMASTVQSGGELLCIQECTSPIEHMLTYFYPSFGKNQLNCIFQMTS